MTYYRGAVTSPFVRVPFGISWDKGRAFGDTWGQVGTRRDKILEIIFFKVSHYTFWTMLNTVAGGRPRPGVVFRLRPRPRTWLFDLAEAEE